MALNLMKWKNYKFKKETKKTNQSIQFLKETKTHI